MDTLVEHQFSLDSFLRTLVLFLLSAQHHADVPQRTGNRCELKFNNINPLIMENQTKTVQNSNLDIYEKVRSVPENATSKIQGGRLQGKSDINPMWRIKSLTELFGPVGFGWYTEVIKTWTEVDEESDVAVFVDINLFVKKDGEWSRPIYGTGGNKLVTHEKKGGDVKPFRTPYLDDDAYKKAYTDAISVAAKALGIGADVYWDADKSKYNETQEPQAAHSAPVRPTLSPKSPSWKQAVAFTASQNDTEENIRQRIQAKYSITESDLDLLLVQSGKKS